MSADSNRLLHLCSFRRRCGWLLKLTRIRIASVGWKNPMRRTAKISSGAAAESYYPCVCIALIHLCCLLEHQRRMAIGSFNRQTKRWPGCSFVQWRRNGASCTKADLDFQDRGKWSIIPSHDTRHLAALIGAAGARAFDISTCNDLLPLSWCLMQGGGAPVPVLDHPAMKILHPDGLKRIASRSQVQRSRCLLCL